MATLKLKKMDGPPAKPAKPTRAPVRGAGSGVKTRPTLSQAQAARDEREARYQEQLRQRFGDKPPAQFARRDEGGPAPGSRPPRRDDPRRDPRADPRNAPRHDPRAAPRGEPRRDSRNAAFDAPRPDPRNAPHRDPRQGPRGPGPAPYRGPQDDGRGAPRRDAHDRRDPRDPRDPPDPRDPRDPRNPRDVRSARDDRDPRGLPRPQRHAAPFQAPSGPNTAFGSRPRPPARPPARSRHDEDDDEDDTPQHAEQPGSVRLSKRMSELGIASRREADEWIPKGWVRVDGKVITELGSRVMPGQLISIEAKARDAQALKVTVLLNKPVGYVSGQAEDGYEPASVLVTAENQWREDRSAIRHLRSHLRGLAPAGRLDIDSVGLLVLTQDGRIAKQLIGEDSDVEKEYLVRVQPLDGQPLPDDKLALLRHGLSLDGEALRPAQVEWVNEDQLRFVLKEGKKRQIRRMCEAVGLKVLGLKRVRIGLVMLGDLPPGAWRYLRGDEHFVPTAPRI